MSGWEADAYRSGDVRMPALPSSCQWSCEGWPNSSFPLFLNPVQSSTRYRAVSFRFRRMEGRRVGGAFRMRFGACGEVMLLTTAVVNDPIRLLALAGVG